MRYEIEVWRDLDAVEWYHAESIDFHILSVAKGENSVTVQMQKAMREAAANMEAEGEALPKPNHIGPKHGGQIRIIEIL